VFWLNLFVLGIFEGMSSESEEFWSGAVAVAGLKAQGKNSIFLVKRIKEEGLNVGLHFS
jgi:hypothetical protein